MKKCPHCKEEINKGATKCPKCQSDLRSWGRRHPIFTAFILCFFLSAFIQALTDTQDIMQEVSIDQEKQQDSRLTEESKKILIKGYVEEDTYPDAVLEVTNNTGHTIDLFAFRANLFNNADEMQYEQISRDDYFAGQSQEVILPGRTVTLRWQLSLFPHATKIGNIKVIKLHYKDTDETIR